MTKPIVFVFPLLTLVASVPALAQTGGASGVHGRDAAAGQHGQQNPHAQGSTHGGAAAPEAPLDWAAEEAGMLANQRQLTFPDVYIKAGESYFSPDGSKVVFQAVEKPEDGGTPAEYYGMYVADVVRGADGRITGLANHRRLSPKGSANTCGWFHPTEPDTVIFASTISAPTESAPPGYQRGTGRYRWMFPPEMQIVSCDLRTADGTIATLKRLVQHNGAYQAECSVSPDGKTLLYCSLDTNQGDLYVKDVASGKSTCIVDKPGYDGGPFFSPDGKRICWRSDRRGDNLLQLFVADLVFDSAGRVVGIGPEHELTNDQNVNWCPFWTPDGRSLVFGTSREGHRNYEVFMLDADPGNLPGSDGPIRYGTNVRRVTAASGADVLPAFSADGRTMIWTSQRGEGGSSQLWVADFLPASEPARK
ncbi:MAG: PD40 domain-containing protein [Phycisphaerales bacterium]|nr:PD40 domain-containing protein [Phycisphaerales bacterium]